MASWLVLGLGNPLSGADGFGPAVVERLRDGTPVPGVEIVDAGTDLLGWIARFADYDRVVLVDAVAVGDPATPPCVATIGEETFTAWDAASAGAHEMSPLAAVRLFRALQHGTSITPVIQLVGFFVSETAFARRPDAAEIDAGVDAVQQLVASRF